MTPFYFGTGARRLFGIYEPAATGGMGKRAAVLCHPWGAEYVYAHRTMRQLAVKLSGAGFHTLRFDFFGTGDSAGDMADADLAGWEADTELAMEELRDIVGATHVALVGLRLGATIAARVAARRSRDINALVLWDPVVSGADYLRSLGAGCPPTPAPTPAPAPAAAEGGQTLAVRGFPLTPPLVRDFRSIELAPLLAAPATRSLMLVTEPAPSQATLPGASDAHAGAEGAAEGITQRANQGAGSLAIETMTSVYPWIEDTDSMGIVPVAVIQRIVAWLG